MKMKRINHRKELEKLIHERALTSMYNAGPITTETMTKLNLNREDLEKRML